MAERKEAVRAWAVLGRTKDDEPYTLDKAVMYPADTDREWLGSRFPGRVVAVEIRPVHAPDDGGKPDG
jgi:hypothetical protein